LNHFAKDCKERIAKGHAITVADIEEGLFNEGYFGESAQEVDSVHQFYHSKKLVSGTNTAPAGNPNNHGNTSNNKPFVFDDLTFNMIKVLCAEKGIELEK
jgi:hypothetical protein